jgi:CheY-like chemotaxis protein
MERETRPVRALICDDNRDHRLTLGILLRSEGYIVHLAKDGTEALSIAAAYRPNVIFLDLQMPGQSGFDVAQEIQRRYPDECPLLIALTANKDSKDRELAEISGFHHFLVKPYEHLHIIELLASLD